MKKHNLFLFSFSCLAFSFLLHSCKRINEATELGGDLIPAVDNINTFEVSYPVESYTTLFNDTAKVLSTEQLALGTLNDPEFGTTKSDIYFNVTPPSNLATSINPFYNKDSVQGIDSVVLSLAYTGAYGDTNSLQTISVEEIAQQSGFSDTMLYPRNKAAFITTGVLGTKTFTPSQLNDSIALIRKRDTTKVANVLRISLNNSLGERFKNLDTTNTANGGYRNDSIFLKIFRGLAIKTTGGTGLGALSYFNIADVVKTKLTVYFRVQKGGKIDTTSTDFVHSRNGQANLISRTPAGGYQAYLTNGSAPDDKVYIQSTPGSYGAIVLKGVDTLSNKIVHRAELVAYRLPTPRQDVFTPPSRLYLDRKSNVDSVNILSKDLFDLQGALNASFGGDLKSDGTYRFTITRYVQDVITRNLPNDTLRLFAPSLLFYPFLRDPVQINSQVANGRVVVAGGNYADPALRMRLRIIYSNIK